MHCTGRMAEAGDVDMDNAKTKEEGMVVLLGRRSYN